MKLYFYQTKNRCFCKKNGFKQHCFKQPCLICFFRYLCRSSVSAANVTRLKKSLMVKDLITISAPKHLEMSDPILALWLKRRVWKES